MSENDKHQYFQLLLEMDETIRAVLSSNGYEQIRCIGEGAIAKCYEVQDRADGNSLACKVVEAEFQATATKEADIHKMLRHPHIVRLDNWFSDAKKNTYLIMELCGNKDLSHLIERRGQITEDEARFFFRQILMGTQYLHENGVIHRDLKPANCFLDSDMQIKIGDFGWATGTDEKQVEMAGTPNYIAPEVLYDKPPTSKVDVWALGCILFYLLAGRSPFEESEEDSTEAVYDRIKHSDFYFPEHFSEFARDLITSLLCFNPERRPSIQRILNSPFMANGVKIASLPSKCLTTKPKFFEVEGVVESRLGANDELEYLIKWKGLDHSHNSWQAAFLVHNFRPEGTLQILKNNLTGLASQPATFQPNSGKKEMKIKLDKAVVKPQRKRNLPVRTVKKEKLPVTEMKREKQKANDAANPPRKRKLAIPVTKEEKLPVAIRKRGETKISMALTKFGNPVYNHEGRDHHICDRLKGNNKGIVTARCKLCVKGPCKGYAWFYENGDFIKYATPHTCKKVKIA